jgi:hypothetical protein
MYRFFRVITLAREYGSGGCAIAKSVAERINWTLLDRISAVSGSAVGTKNMRPTALLKQAVPSGNRFEGIVYGHRRLPDGKPIHTSRVRAIISDGVTRLAVTENTIYVLE